MYEKIKRIKEWIKNGYASPYAIDINPTYACNLRCKFCNGYQAGLNDKKFDKIPNEKFLTIVKEAIDLGIKEFHIAGDGEPLMKKKLFLEIAKIIKYHKLYGKVTTNGTLFDEELIKELVELEWDIINLSIEGSNDNIHDYLVGINGAFEKCVNAINFFNKYKTKLRKKNPLIRISTVVTNKNIYDLKNIIKLAHRLNIKHVDFEPLAIAHSKVKELQIKQKQKGGMDKIFNEVFSVSNKHFIYTNILNLKKEYMSVIRKLENKRLNFINNKKIFNPACFQPWYRIVIRPNGQVQPCCNLYEPNADNIKEKNLKEIWYGNYFNKIRENILQHKFYEDCSRCNAWIMKESNKLRRLIDKNRIFLNTYYHLYSIGKKFIPDMIKDYFYFRIYKNE